ncbi:hypothetical protein, partial [Streptomyces sp. NPDC005568]|uniref:hypothetical protein n=1 Tax=Streptomyces sp. NPDC005568 TaxID=3156887 RepID=UPI0033B70B38
PELLVWEGDFDALGDAYQAGRSPTRWPRTRAPARDSVRLERELCPPHPNEHARPIIFVRDLK